MAARECYIAMLETDNHLQTMCIKEQRTMAEPVEGLEEVILDDARLKRMIRVRTLVSHPVCQAITMFLREN